MRPVHAVTVRHSREVLEGMKRMRSFMINYQVAELTWKRMKRSFMINYQVAELTWKGMKRESVAARSAAATRR